MAQLDQAEYSIIDDILIAGFYSFGDDGMSFIVFNLFDPQQFHEDDIGHRGDTHISPGFTIIMVFIKKKLLYFVGFSAVSRE